MTEEAIFHDALAKPPAERAAFLDAACAGDADLRARLAKLLAAHADAGPLPAAADHTGAFTPNPLRGTAEFGTTQPGAIIAGRYTLEQKLGEGGMGEVWVAKQCEPVKRRVALKLIKAGMDSKAVLARFEQERQALGMMDHPNIAKVLDGGLTDDRRPFFVMELVNGLPLTRFCDEAKLTPRQRLELFVPICQAVQHAHQKGVVHRDLKPSNILVTLIDGKAVPKVIDFGVAKATAGKLTDESLSTQFGAVVGTLEYMSPEQAGFSGQDVDTRADIYSLGVILYELLTGLKPHDGRRLREAALSEMIRIIQEEEPSKPSTRLSTDEALPSLAAMRQTEPKKLMALLRGELDWVVMKCLEKQRDRRYETANALARDVQRYLADEPVEARPPSTGYRLRKFARRNRPQVIAAALVLLALVAGVVGTTWGLLEAQRQWAAAERARDGEATQRGIAEGAAKAERQARYEAVEILKETTDDVMESLIASRPTLGRAERAFLERSLARWERFAAASGDDDDESGTRSMGVFRVSFLRMHLGDADGAAEGFRRVVAMREKLLLKYPRGTALCQGLASAYANLGRIAFEQRRMAEARDHYVKALAIAEALSREHPRNPEYRFTVASVHRYLARDFFGEPVSALIARLRTAEDILVKLVDEFPMDKDHGEFRFELAEVQGLLADRQRGPDRKAEGLRRWQTAIDTYERLAADYPDRTHYRGALASALQRESTWLVDYGEVAAEDTRRRKALQIRAAIAADFPTIPKYRTELAASHIDYGMFLLRAGKPVEAEQQTRLGLAIIERLRIEFPKDNMYRMLAASTRSNLATALVKRQEQAAAEVEFRAAVDLLAPVAEDPTDGPQFRAMLAGFRGNLGQVLINLKQFVEAEREFAAALELVLKQGRTSSNDLHYATTEGRMWLGMASVQWELTKRAESSRSAEKSVALLEQAVARFPGAVEPAVLLADGCSRLAYRLQIMGAPRDRRRALADRSAELLRPILAKLPDYPNAKDHLNTAFAVRAQCFREEGKFDEAVAEWTRAIEIAGPDRAAYQRSLRASSLVRGGKVAEALAEVDAIEKDPTAKGNALYNCACALALAAKDSSRREELAKHAVATLRRCAASGYREAALAEKDADFDGIRDRHDFRATIDEIRKAATKPRGDKP